MTINPTTGGITSTDDGNATLLNQQLTALYGTAYTNIDLNSIDIHRPQVQALISGEQPTIRTQN